MSSGAAKATKGTWRAGAFIDVQNLYFCTRAAFGENTRTNYDVLRDYLREQCSAVKLVAFTCHNPQDEGQQKFINALALMGYRVVTKPLKTMPGGNIKANVDMEMALEILTSAPHLDEVILITGDGDFAPLVDHLCRMGKVTKVIGPDRFTSPDLIRACDEFINLSDIEGVLTWS